MSNQGTKYDAGKLPLHLIPPEATRALAEVLDTGRKKYGERNWENGIPLESLYAALQRHMLEWREGKERDAETNLPHLAHVLCNAVMLYTLWTRMRKCQYPGKTDAQYPGEN